MPNAKRRVLCLFLALFMTVPFAGCSSGETVEPKETVGAESTENTENETETETEPLVSDELPESRSRTPSPPRTGISICP